MNMNTRILHAGQAYDIEAAGEILRRGGLVAIPTETVYGLAGNALDPAVSARIYAVKGRPSDNPLIVHIAALEDLYPLTARCPRLAETLAAAFSGRAAALERGLVALGGRKLTGGDVAYEVDAFPDFPVAVRFWDGDEEFPAQVNLLFDRNATDLIHVESVVTIASQLQVHLERLAGEMGKML